MRRAPDPRSDRPEALRLLRGRLRGNTGKIPAEGLATHLHGLGQGWPWHVLEAAGEAVLRRLSSARREELRVSSRPPRQPFGLHVIRPRGGSRRPYLTVISGVDPLVGSCDCPDFSRSSLGLCKHLLVAFDDLHASPRRLARARAMRGARPTGRSWMSWDPVRPLDGPGDWLGRVTLSAGPRTPRIARWFDRASGRLMASFLDDAPSRLELVSELRAWLRRRPDNLRLEPALARLLAEEEAALRRIAVPGRALRRLKAPLYAYQREGVARFLERGQLLLGDDMGLGKTVQAIASAHALYEEGAIRRGLIVVPNSLKHQWRDEWLRFSSAPIRVVEGRRQERARFFADVSEGFLVVNYEQVLRDAELMRAWTPDLVVLDEAQRIKNWQTRTARELKTLRPAYRLALTGTPLENRLDELVSVMEWVDDRALEPKWRLGPHHTIPDEDGGRARGAKHLDTLRERIRPRFLRRRRAEVLGELPDRADHRRPVELCAEQRVMHDELDVPIARIAAVGRRRPLTQPEFLKLMSLITRQRVIANGLAQHDFEDVWPRLRSTRPSQSRLESLASPKLVALRDLVEEIAVEQGRKVVVFSQWRRMLLLADWVCADVLGEHGLRAAFFTGAQNLRARARSVVELHDDPRTRVLFCTDAGSVGLNLQRAADCCINVDLPWNPAVLEQRIARIHRLGQRRPIDVINLVAEASVETRMEEALRSKTALFSGLLDGDEDTVVFDPDDASISLSNAVALEPEQLPAQQSSGVKVVGADAPDTDVEGGVVPMAAHPGSAMEALFAGLEMTRHPSGGLTLIADAAAAAELEAVFASLAKLMGAAG